MVFLVFIQPKAGWRDVGLWSSIGDLASVLERTQKSPHPSQGAGWLGRSTGLLRTLDIHFHAAIGAQAGDQLLAGLDALAFAIRRFGLGGARACNAHLTG
jgi:hypothetical protein